MFQLIDEARRQFGSWFDAAGLGKDEAPFRIAATMNGARLRAYQERRGGGGPAVLIVSAPFKGPYIWDLMPEVSPIRKLIGHGLQVYLLEWTAPAARDDGLGLADYSHRLIDRAAETVEAETGQSDIILAGHSLGGTFAAIHLALRSDPGRGLLLVDAPLKFGPEGGRIAQLARAFPGAATLTGIAGGPVPGSLLSLLSVSLFPEEFLLQRYLDLGVSLPEASALELHLRVVRWTLDEFPMPSRLFEETLALLYREDRFARNSLEIGREVAGIAKLRTPVLAILNPMSGVVPPASTTLGLRGSPGRDVRILLHKGSRGSALEHVAPLVSRRAHKELWPKVLSWMDDLERTSSTA